MSYLTLAAGIPDFSKAVISFWFRVPRESVIAAANASGIDAGGIGIGEGYTMLQQIIPLVTFGQQQVRTLYQEHLHDVAVLHPYTPPGADFSVPFPGTTYITPSYVYGGSYKEDPCFIGLLCNSDGTFSVVFKLQMDVSMSLGGGAVTYATTRMDIWSGSDPSAPTDTSLGSGFVGLFPNIGYSTIAAVPEVDNGELEFFQVQANKQYEPDIWHHVLLSFDVGGLISIGTPFASSECRLWYAIDDKDYRGAENLQPYRDTGGMWGPDNLDPNAILTRTAWRYSGYDPAWEATQYYKNHYIGLPSGTLSGVLVPSDEAPIGIPSSTAYMDGIFRCEMAEFQMWTGVTLDTGVISNRRAFVDEDGKPVVPEGTEDDPRSPAGRLLGKEPEILLHGSSDWKVGHNTGTIGIEEDSEGNKVDIPEGQFKPTAKIEAWEPDPSLEETTTA